LAIFKSFIISTYAAALVGKGILESLNVDQLPARQFYTNF